MRSFYAEYTRGADDLLAFFAKPPRALLESPPLGRPWDETLVAAIQRYNETLGYPKTFDATAPVIITGQQPALFGGPLYTVLKAITTIKLAALVEEHTGTHCVPVYWVGSEDHDFDEARGVSLLTRDHRERKFHYVPETDIDGLPMYRVPIEGSLREFAEEALALAPGGEFAEEVGGFLIESLDAAASLSDWAARVLARLFASTRLTFFSPDIPEARAIGAGLIRREIDDPLATTDRVNEQAVALERLEFPPQVVKNANECNFFIEFDGRRRKVTWDRDIFRVEEEDAEFDKDAIVALLESEQTRFSPNVALRCAVQQHLFPVAAYVAGPGELAYWGQLKPVFESYDLPMPVVYPRAHAAITTIKLNKLLRKLGLVIKDLSRPMDELRDSAMRNTTKNPAVRYIEEQRGAFAELMDGFESGLRERDKAAGDMAEGMRKEVFSQINRLERALLNNESSKSEATLKQLDRLCVSLMPDRKPQERTYTIFSWAFEYGWNIIPKLMEAIDIETFELNEVEL